MTRKVRIAIVGAGPAGAAFYNELLTSGLFSVADIALFDSSGKVASGLEAHGVFLQNHLVRCAAEFSSLVDGAVQGPEVADRIREMYPCKPISERVSLIRKENEQFHLLTSNGEWQADVVALATGLRPKLLPITAFDHSRHCYDLTFYPFSHYKELDFRQSEVIFIGSGDNALFKVGRLAEWIEKNNLPHEKGCLKLWIKGQFHQQANQDFIRIIKKHLNSGIIELRDDLWDVSVIESGKAGTVARIHSAGGEYRSDRPGGAFLSIHTGFVPNFPDFDQCSSDDCLLIGDLALLARGVPCTIYGAITQSRCSARVFTDPVVAQLTSVVFRHYELGGVSSIERPVLSVSKFISADHHFVLTNSSGRQFFVKRYPLSHLEKIRNELAAIEHFQSELAIPAVIKTIDGCGYVVEDSVVYVLYAYIDAPNFLERNILNAEFVATLSSMERCLIRVSGEGEPYNFAEHLASFEEIARQLTRVIENSGQPYAERDLEYLNFMRSEAAVVTRRLFDVKVPTRFIHGDFLKQNLLKDADGLVWVLDWEKSRQYLTVVDVFRAITFTLFQPDAEAMGMDAAVFAEYAGTCLAQIPVTEHERGHAMDLYYFHLVTNIDFLKRLYQDGQTLKPMMAGEDYALCRWFKEHGGQIQENINKRLQELLLIN